MSDSSGSATAQAKRRAARRCLAAFVFALAGTPALATAQDAPVGAGGALHAGPSAPAAVATHPSPGPQVTPPPEPELAADESTEMIEATGNGGVVLAGGLRVEVTADQRATIIGDTPSLLAVIEETCRQAGIQLRTYAAPDRRYAGRLDNVPVADALRSMLRLESYLLGVRADSAGRERVTWLCVLGSADGTGTRPPVSGAPFAQRQPAPAGQPQGDKFALSSSLMFQAFGTFDPQRREQAQREILARIADPDQFSKFLASDPRELAKLFNRYRGAADTIRRIQAMADRVEVQAKFAEILAEVERNQKEAK